MKIITAVEARAPGSRSNSTAAPRLLEEAEAHTGLPLQEVLRDPVGMTGMYTVVYNP